ncbi:hypothetical protein [Paenibacillus maysiensis]|uniref:hypothetical protein n=1 Tax=Paenibacillus maysiensis TaxID=1155954 RepID=UPI0004ACC401|nr:hypothetical protein [Paenibacillus maysiensis]
MKKHHLELPWEIDRNKVEIFINSLITAYDLEKPAEVRVMTPTWEDSFVLQ